MDDDILEAQSDGANQTELDQQPVIEDIEKLRTTFHSRLIAASLRTEAVRAGMIDLDGLKLVDLSQASLDEGDSIVGGRKIMAELRRTKPWLFGAPSTSSAAVAPTSLPVRQKTAMDMTDEEYATARFTVTKRQF
jgi:hypothetical protein